MKRKTIMTVFLAVVTAACLCFCLLYFTDLGSTYYYTKIDNTKIEQMYSRGGVIDFNRMDYRYTLDAYNSEGHKKTVEFGADRELKDNAFLRLKFMPVRGVLDWQEVKYDELPIDVQSKYTKPNG